MRVPPASLNLGYDVRGANIAKSGRKARVPLCLCFIDLQKEYDSIDRSLLWQIPARYGVPRRMTAVIPSSKKG